MPQINFYSLKKSLALAKSNLAAVAIPIISLRQKIVLSDLKYVKLLYKLAYTLLGITTRPKYFFAFTCARFNFVRQVFLLFSQLWSSLSTTKSNKDDSNSLFSTIEPINVARTMHRDGIFLGLSVPPDWLSEFLQYLSQQNCYGGGRPDVGFRIRDKAKLDRVFPQPFYVARYFNLSQDCPQISQLVNDPKLREIATRYIGQKAQYTGTSLFWTFPIEGKSCDAEQQKFRHFHYDIDDFAGLRFCFYLTDVTLDDGPHICIRGSHIKKSLLHVFNFLSRIQSETELTKVYDPQQFITITGNSGFGFVEDTFCFHKGSRPKNQARLFLQLHFAAHNYNPHQAYLDDRDPATLKSYPLPVETCAVN